MIFLFNVLAHLYQKHRKNDLIEAKQIAHLNRSISLTVTWVKLLKRALISCLIVWPSKFRVKATLPDCFKKLYPQTRTIIDCTEIFMDTPSSLEVQALLWSDYKSHCIVKFLIAISPNGATTWMKNTHDYYNSMNIIKIIMKANTTFLRLKIYFHTVGHKKNKIKEML